MSSSENLAKGRRNSRTSLPPGSQDLSLSDDEVIKPANAVEVESSASSSNSKNEKLSDKSSRKGKKKSNPPPFNESEQELAERQRRGTRDHGRNAHIIINAEDLRTDLQHELSRKTMQHRVGDCVQSHYVEMGIFFLVLFYCVVVFIQIALPPPCEHVKSQTNVVDPLSLKWQTAASVVPGVDHSSVPDTSLSDGHLLVPISADYSTFNFSTLTLNTTTNLTDAVGQHITNMTGCEPGVHCHFHHVDGVAVSPDGDSGTRRLEGAVTASNGGATTATTGEFIGSESGTASVAEANAIGAAQAGLCGVATKAAASVVLEGLDQGCPVGMPMNTQHTDDSTEYCGTCRLSSSWPVVSQWLDVLRYFDVGILTIFVLEIILKTFAFRREFFADVWNIVDCVVVFASVAFVMTELLMPEDDFSSIFSVRLILRLLRVFVAGRRLTTTSRVLSKIKNQQKVNMDVPSENLIDLLKRFEVNHRLPKSDRNLCKELKEIVANKTLYEAVVTAKDGEENAAAAWIHESSSMMVHQGSTLGNRSSTMQTSKGSIDGGAQINKEDTYGQYTQLQKAFEHDFDVFAFFEEIPEGLSPLAIYVMYHMDMKGFMDPAHCDLNINRAALQAWTTMLGSGYRDLPYHNIIHAVDVTATTAMLMWTCGLADMCQLDDEHRFALPLAAAMHDVEHPGTNNPFQVATRSRFAIRYNDKAVLESHHIAVGYALMQQDGLNFMEEVSEQSYKSIRSTIVQTVLATDMAGHFQKLGDLKTRKNKEDFARFENSDDQMLMMCLALHAADISNPTKKIGTYVLWTERVMTEFFMQGDFEKDKGLPISMLMDRKTTNIAKAQKGFIEVLVQPLWNEMLTVLQWSDRKIIDNAFAENLEFFTSKMEECEREMQGGTQRVPFPPTVTDDKRYLPPGDQEDEKDSFCRSNDRLFYPAAMSASKTGESPTRRAKTQVIGGSGGGFLSSFSPVSRGLTFGGSGNKCDSVTSSATGSVGGQPENRSTGDRSKTSGSLGVKSPRL